MPELKCGLGLLTLFLTLLEVRRNSPVVGSQMKSIKTQVAHFQRRLKVCCLRHEAFFPPSQCLQASPRPLCPSLQSILPKKPPHSKPYIANPVFLPSLEMFPDLVT